MSGPFVVPETMGYSMIRASLFVAMAVAAATPAAASAQSAPGATLFAAKCQICHSVAAKGAPAMLAPNLRGVVGRKAASGAFSGYSPALKKSGLTWTPETLGTFLTAPTKLVPGTRMVVMVADAKQRANIIAWLATQR